MATEFVRGQKSQLSALTNGTDLYVGIVLEAPGDWDISCFGLDKDGQLSDDSYFVFFNQPKSPEGAIQKLGPQSGDTDSFRITLDKIPAKIEKLTFCAALDGPGSAKAITRGYLRLVAGGTEVMRYSFSGNDFSAERAVMIADVYKKGVWRVAAVGQGFAGGLAELLKSFGGEVAEEEPAPAAAPGFAPPPAPAGGTPGFAPPPGPPPQQAPPPPPQQAAAAPVGGAAPAAAAPDLPINAQPTRPGAMVSLQKYKEAPTTGRWTKQSSKMVKCTLGPEAYAKRGSMVAYQGNVDFDYKGSGGLRQFFEARMTGQKLQLMRCTGNGEVFFAEDATDLHIVELNGQSLSVNANNVLAFDATLRTEIQRIESAGIPGGVMFSLLVSGQGTMVIMTHGTPVTIPVQGPTFADVNAVVAWTAGMRVSVASQVRIQRNIYAGVSGEPAALQFMGLQGHFVVVQPYEV
ncbi:TerD family protein [Fodinicola acaciae]|uniref:TerD family protein n=1 Tax=Fodinicola acaciae TaxID=2681555 RepID=UPI0013D706B6|nr:TerD family protein [Fodinicola acaciae]